MRVWIEICNHNNGKRNCYSFTLLWGCGLKFDVYMMFKALSPFHPLMRVWIEITLLIIYKISMRFHPLMRVWIEIGTIAFWLSAITFHPLMRVWIEITIDDLMKSFDRVSPSYEGVDWNNKNLRYNSPVSRFTLLWGCGLKSLWLRLSKP